ncbi:hypothetical protein ILUMI_13228 [Ignelater luminosus]|uniref:Mitochondrial protein n=1 Tax=Ignelater luminosus TaxID=2038154 RepID=A0A8K0CX31_IGNLU|nr:hypothetical protein ILUMI_13228 [Ignelater luminosus]
MFGDDFSLLDISSSASGGVQSSDLESNVHYLLIEQATLKNLLESWRFSCIFNMCKALAGIMFAGHLSEFDPANADWSVFQKRLENYFTTNAIEDDKLKGANLLTSLNEDGYKLIYNLCLPIIPKNKKYSELTKIFSKRFKPNLSVFAAPYEFYQSKKRLNESAKEWAARMKSLAGTCYFETTELEMVLQDHFIVGYDRGPVQDRYENVFKPGLDKVSYLGFEISKMGLHTSEEKVAAINKAPVPKNVTQLKSFLGLITYYGKFVPNLATILHPLYNLLKNKVTYKKNSDKAVLSNWSWPTEV